MRSEAFACETSLCVASVCKRVSSDCRSFTISCASALRLFTVEFVSFGFGLHESVAGVCVRECMRASVCVRACVRAQARLCAFVCALG
jgi:hypothetical protein